MVCHPPLAPLSTARASSRQLTGWWPVMDRRCCAERQALPQVCVRRRTNTLPIRYRRRGMGRLHLLPQPPPQGPPSSTGQHQDHPSQGHRRKAPVTMPEPVSSVRCSPKDARGLQLHIYSHWQGWVVAGPATIPPGPRVGSLVRLLIRPVPFSRPTRTSLPGSQPTIPTARPEIHHTCSLARSRGGNKRGF